MQQLLEYLGNHPYLAMFAVAMLVAVAANELRLRKTSFAAIGPQDVIRMMNQGGIVLDLRKPEEFAAGHIQGARNFSSDQLLKANETLKKYREKAVVLVCESGSLGAAGARELARQGFTAAFNLRGGLAGWRSENMPLAKADSARSGKSG